MSETSIIIIIVALAVVLFVLKEYAFNVLPASHWINRTFNRPGHTDAGGDGWFDCDGGDGGD